MKPQALAWNTISSYSRYILSFAVAFLLVPVIVQSVGTQDFGLYSLLFSVLGVVGLLDLGFAAAAVKFVAELRGIGDVRRRNEVLSTLLAAYLGLALLALLVLGIVSVLLDPVLGIPNELYSKAVTLLWILGFRMVVLQLPLGLFRGILFGEQHIVLVNFISAGSNLVYGVGAALALWSGMGILSVAWVSLGAMLLEHLLYLVLCRQMVPDLEVSYRLVRKDRLWELSSFSVHQLVCDVAALILLQVDLLLVQMVAGLSEVALYAVALRLATQVYLFCKQFVNTLSPRFAELNGRGAHAEIGRLFLASTEIALGPALLFMGAALFFGQEALQLWVGVPFDRAWSILIILFAAVVVGIPHSVASNLLANTGYHKELARASVLSVVVNVIVSLLLFPWMGIPGIAMGTLVTRLCLDYPLVVSRACRLHGFTVSAVILHQIRGVAVPLSAALLVMVCAYFVGFGNSLLRIVLVGCVGGSAYFGAFWFVRRAKVYSEISSSHQPVGTSG